MSSEKIKLPELPSTPIVKQPESVAELTIPGISEHTIGQYFATLNAAAYTATAELFAVDGVLHPPFEEAITGRLAIAAYLEAEAKGMQLHPHHGSSRALAGGNTEFKVMGNVQTPLLGVNVGWCFVLDPNAEIVSVRVKLLAALEELLHLKRSE